MQKLNYVPNHDDAKNDNYEFSSRPMQIKPELQVLPELQCPVHTLTTDNPQRQISESPPEIPVIMLSPTDCTNIPNNTHNGVLPLDIIDESSNDLKMALIHDLASQNNDLQLVLKSDLAIVEAAPNKKPCNVSTDIVQITSSSYKLKVSVQDDACCINVSNDLKVANTGTNHKKTNSKNTKNFKLKKRTGYISQVKPSTKNRSYSTTSDKTGTNNHRKYTSKRSNSDPNGNASKTKANVVKKTSNQLMDTLEKVGTAVAVKNNNAELTVQKHYETLMDDCNKKATGLLAEGLNHQTLPEQPQNELPALMYHSNPKPRTPNLPERSIVVYERNVQTPIIEEAYPQPDKQDKHLLARITESPVKMPLPRRIRSAKTPPNNSRNTSKDRSKSAEMTKEKRNKKSKKQKEIDLKDDTCIPLNFDSESQAVIGINNSLIIVDKNQDSPTLNGIQDQSDRETDLDSMDRNLLVIDSEGHYMGKSKGLSPIPELSHSVSMDSTLQLHDSTEDKIAVIKLSKDRKDDHSLQAIEWSNKPVNSNKNQELDIPEHSKSPEKLNSSPKLKPKIANDIETSTEVGVVAKKPAEFKINLPGFADVPLIAEHDATVPHVGLKPKEEPVSMTEDLLMITGASLPSKDVEEGMNLFKQYLMF